jgi:ketosteroid isomerase-like protein
MRMHVIIPAAVLLCGCGAPRAPITPPPARAPATDSLFRLDESRADSVVASGAVNGALALLAPNVVFLRRGAPILFGRDAARSLMRAAGAAPGRVAWEPIGGGVSSDLRSGYTFGVTVRWNAEQPLPSFERYIAYWERAPGASWHITAYAEIGGPALSASDAPIFDSAAITPVVPRLSAALAKSRDEMRDADSLFADLSYRRGMAAAFSETVAPDGAVFADPALVVGPAAIADAYRIIAQGTSLSWRPVYADIAGSADLGYTIGEYVSTGRGPSGAAVQRVGKYLTVWRRQPDGSWKFMIDGGNPSR